MLKRLLSETPKFWRGVQIVGVLLISISGGLLSSSIEMSEDVHELLKYILTIGGTLAGIGQFAINDNGEIESKKD